MKLPLQQNFVAIAIPAVIGMIAVLLINHDRSASRTLKDHVKPVPPSRAWDATAR